MQALHGVLSSVMTEDGYDAERGCVGLSLAGNEHISKHLLYSCVIPVMSEVYLNLSQTNVWFSQALSIARYFSCRHELKINYRIRSL